MRFKDVVGQERVKEMLVKSVDKGRVSHAQMFSGKSGYGTLPLAIAYAQYINCTNKQEGDSCGECASCHKMERLEHPDLHFVFPTNVKRTSGQRPTCDMFLQQWREIIKETNGYFDEQEWYRKINIENQQGIISRNDADEVIKKLSFKAFEAKYKVMIIWLPEKMRVEAANTLLKILEEPWERTLFVMVSEEPSVLLPTIISRVQEVIVTGVESDEIESYLQQKNLSQGAKLKSLSRIAKGDVIEARRLVEGGEQSVTKEHFKMFAELMRFSYANKHMELLDWAESVASLGREEQKQFLEYCIDLLRESYMMNAGMNDITYLWGEELKFCENFSPFIGNHNIEQLVQEMEKAILHVSQNGNPRIIFPHFVLEVSKHIVKV